MTGYTKLFGSIVTSTIWRESAPTKVVWITMLALSDKDGIVSGSVPGLAHIAGVSVKQCEQAIDKFLAPDQHSRSHEHEGRRIEVIEGGWQLLNHGKYRIQLSQDDRREQDRLRKQKLRLSTSVRTCPQMSAVSAQADTEADAYPDTKAEQRESARALPEDWISRIRGIGIQSDGTNRWRDVDASSVEHSFFEQVAEKGVDPAKLFEAVCRIYVATDSGKFAPRLSEVIRRWQEPLEFWGRDGASSERVSAAEAKQQGAKSAVSRAWAKHRAIAAADGGDAAVLPERPAY